MFFPASTELLFCAWPACRAADQRELLTEADQQEVLQEAWGDVPVAERTKLLLQYTHVVTNVRYV
jgi:hypothetical protein